MTSDHEPAKAHNNEGGCICGGIRYTTTADPIRVTICHCMFCQRLTGSAYFVEPIFNREDVQVNGVPKIYERASEGSGKIVRLHFCERCGTTLFLSFDRFPDVLGLCAGTFDDPNWFDRGPSTCRHIFTRFAQSGVTLPAGMDLYAEHAFQPDGTPNQPTRLETHRQVTRGAARPRT